MSRYDHDDEFQRFLAARRDDAPPARFDWDGDRPKPVEPHAVVVGLAFGALLLALLGIGTFVALRWLAAGLGL